MSREIENWTLVGPKMSHDENRIIGEKVNFAF